MLTLIVLAFLLGCVVAWNLWAQPKWMEDGYKKLVSFITSKSDKP